MLKIIICITVFLMILFLFCACKLSSKCSKMEEEIDI